jgi:hypothetical protein
MRYAAWYLGLLVLLCVVLSATLIVVALEAPQRHDPASELGNYRLIECTFHPLDAPPTSEGQRTHPTIVARSEANLDGRPVLVQSRNRAGYAVAPDLRAPRRNAVLGASACWHLPRLTGPALAPDKTGLVRPREAASPAHVCFGVALDGLDVRPGERGEAAGEQDAPIVEIGTESRWDSVGGAQIDMAWFGMGDHGRRTMIAGFPLAVGDVVSGSVQVVDRRVGQYRLVLRNDTRGIAVVVPSSLTGGGRGQNAIAQFTLQLPVVAAARSARPFLEPLPLADFGAVSFHECLCLVGSHARPIGDRALQHARIELLPDATCRSGPPSARRPRLRPSAIAPNDKAFSLVHPAAQGPRPTAP